MGLTPVVNSLTTVANSLTTVVNSLTSVANSFAVLTVPYLEYKVIEFGLDLTEQ